MSSQLLSAGKRTRCQNTSPCHSICSSGLSSFLSNVVHTSLLCNEAEAEALDQGLIGCKEIGATKVCVEGDCKNLIDAVQGRTQPPWEIWARVCCARKKMEDLSEVNIQHKKREENRAADWIANIALDVQTVRSDDIRRRLSLVV